MKLAVICELIGSDRHGGEQHAMLRMAESIKNLGNKVDIYYYLNPNPNFRVKTWLPMKLLLLPFIRDMFFLPFIGKGILNEIDEKYDTINISSSTLAALYKPRSKLVITCHILRSQKFETFSKIPKYRILFNPLAYKIISFFEKRSLHNADQIIVTKEHMKVFLIENFKIPTSKITIVPNSIDTSFFKPLNINKKNQLIFVGRGSIPKGLDTLLEAADQIDAELLIVASKIDDDLLKIAKTKSNVAIKMKATPEELVKLYSESKIFSLPSLDDERQTLSTMEAMACGLPVVVTEKAGGDITSHMVNGVLIDESNPVELAKMVNLILKNNILYKSLASKAREVIVNNYDSKIMTIKYLSILL
jgi:glycosyltransferase involved in cell wall biosynthesis